jgi:hypothetical protein
MEKELDMEQDFHMINKVLILDTHQYNNLDYGDRVMGGVAVKWLKKYFARASVPC